MQAIRFRRIRRRAPNRSIGGDVINVIVLTAVSLFMLLPFVYAVCNAFKPLDELFVFPPRFYVVHPTWDNFHDVFVLMSQSWVPFSRYIFNTLFITVLGVFGHLIIASLAAYAFAKHQFPAGNALFGLVVLALMFSGYVTSIPNYLIMSKIHWLDTYAALVVPALASPLGLFLMKQFMEQLPVSLLESARMDGAREFTVFLRIAMPNVKPAWLTLIIFSFQDLWNMQGSNYIYSEELKTLPYALSQISTGSIARAGATAAVAVMMMIVPIVIFIISQSRILETMSTSGIKE